MELDAVALAPTHCYARCNKTVEEVKDNDGKHSFPCSVTVIALGAEMV
jgi:hypothetical protein